VNLSRWLGHVLGIGGVLETATGLVLLADPSWLASLLLRAPLAGAGLVIGRIGGGGLLSLGVACWTARTTPWSPAGLGVACGLLAYNVVAGVALAVAGRALGGEGLVALCAAGLHGVIGAVLLIALLGRAPRGV